MSGISSQLNARLQAFKTFATEAKATGPAKEKTVASLGEYQTLGDHKITSKVISAETGDKLHYWGRKEEMKQSNNEVRKDLYEAVLEQFGGDATQIPENVKDAMLLEDSGLDKDHLDETKGAFKTGKPLLARRIDAVITEVEKVLAKKRGAASFDAFYNDMKANPDGDMKADFKAKMTAALENIIEPTFRKSKYMSLKSTIDECVKQMVDLLGDNPKAFLHKDMEPLLKSLCKELSAQELSKDEKALLKLSLNSFIDSMQIERKMDEKIAAAFEKKYEIVKGHFESVADGDDKLACIEKALAEKKAFLVDQQANDPQDEEEIKKVTEEIERLKGEVENQKKYLTQLSDGSIRRKVMDAAIKELLNDKEFCALAAKKDFGLVTRNDLADTGKLDTNEACTGKKDTFGEVLGCTSEAIAKYHEQNPGKKICVHVYGDRTFPLCYLLLHVSSQEEAAARDADVKTWAHLIGTGKIKPSKKKKDRFEMATDGKMDSIQGFTIKTQMQFSRQVKNAKPIEVTFLFSSMPSLAKQSHSLDADGDHDFLMDCKAEYTSEAWPVKKSHLPRADKFIAAFHAQQKADDLRQEKIKDAANNGLDTDGLPQREYTEEDYQKAALLLKFSGPNTRFNVFGKNSKEEVRKLLDFVKSNRSVADLEKSRQSFDDAKKSLEEAQAELNRMSANRLVVECEVMKYVDALGKDATARPDLKHLGFEFENLNIKNIKNKKDIQEAVQAEIDKQAKIVESYKKNFEKAKSTYEAISNQVESADGKLFTALMAKAKENYLKVIRKHVREWIIEARETGADVFLGGPIGCGVFGNDAKDVAEVIAEEFKNNGGKMKYLYTTFVNDNGNADRSTYKIFQKAFAKRGLAEAFEEVAQPQGAAGAAQ